MLDASDQNMANLTTISPALVTATLANNFKTGVPVATSKSQLATPPSQVRAKAPNASVVLAIENALGSTGASIP